jgi:predicted PolB exonuclease-like 3'-5' exonuclease
MQPESEDAMNHGYMALDIETVPNPAMVDKMPPPDVKYGNAKKSELRAEIEAEAKRSQIEDMALSPFTGFVCCFSIVDEDGDVAGRCIPSIDGEAELLQRIFHYISHTNTTSPKLVTWNGNGFDLPFIYKRAMLLNLNIGSAPSLSYWTKKYTNMPHCDLMQVFADNGNKYFKLNDISHYVLEKRKIDLDYKLFPAMMAEKRCGEIMDYCKMDAELTLQLFSRASRYLF